MPILQNLTIEVQENEILRLMGYKNEDINQDLYKEVTEEIKKAGLVLHPQIAYEKIAIRSITKKEVVLSNGVILEGEYIAHQLRGCQYIVMSVTTLGKEVDGQIDRSFQSGDYLKGMIQDHIATEALGYVNKVFWKQLVEKIEGTDTGITSSISPGDNGWDLINQKEILACLEAEAIGVTLTESYMMIPMKSTSMIYGFGEHIGIARFGHICSQCTMKGCNYRMDGKIQITVHQGKKKTILEEYTGSNLFEVLRNDDIFVESPCSGKGTCGKCKVLCIKGTPQPTDVDKKHLSKEERDKGYRLACTMMIQNPIEIMIVNQPEEMDILWDQNQLIVSHEPMVTKKYVELKEPSMEDQRSDYQRLKDHLGKNDLEVSMELLKDLSRNIRNAAYKVSVTEYDHQMIHVEQGNTSNISYGLAVDIGTTTVVVYLMDLTTGKTIDVVSKINKQKAYGADIISRIQYTIENENGLLVLQKCIVQQLNEMIQELCNKNGIQQIHLYHMTVAANTTMVHILLGLPCENISKAPYIPVITEEVEIKAREIGLGFNGCVTVLPGVSSYIGGDITAGVLASGMNKSEKISILLDLGTNGEMVIGNKDEFVTCSTAAGPAFEGANIKWGVGGIKGAISKIDFSLENIHETIGQKPPCGICGSGILDAVAELLNYQLMDETGRLYEEEELHIPERLKRRIVTEGDMKGFFIAKNQEGKDIIFTQKDIREVQMAKAAIRAGMDVLLKEKKIKKSDDIHKIYIAGGFGNYMNMKSAIDIGLIPHKFAHKVESIGNSAGTGAKMCLISQSCRRELKEIVGRSKYIELSAKEDFQEYFIEAMYFSS